MRLSRITELANRLLKEKGSKKLPIFQKIDFTKLIKGNSNSNHLPKN